MMFNTANDARGNFRDATWFRIGQVWRGIGSVATVALERVLKPV